MDETFNLSVDVDMPSGKITEDERIKFEYYLLKSQIQNSKINELIEENKKLDKAFNEFRQKIYKKYNKDIETYDVTIDGIFIEKKKNDK